MSRVGRIRAGRSLCGRSSIMSFRRGLLSETAALSLVVLVALPFTAPFSTTDVADFLTAGTSGHVTMAPAHSPECDIAGADVETSIAPGCPSRLRAWTLMPPASIDVNTPDATTFATRRLIAAPDAVAQDTARRSTVLRI